jgi:hypothetical protein
MGEQEPEPASASSGEATCFMFMDTAEPGLSAPAERHGLDHVAIPGQDDGALERS